MLSKKLMKLIAFPISREKLNRRNIASAVAVVLLLAVVAGYVFLQRTDRLPEFNFRSYLQRLAAGVVQVTERGAQPKEQLAQEELEITLPGSAGGAYEQTAEAGEGITHLARQAAKEYLAKTGEGRDLTAEHKVYIEDYLTKKTGDRWLNFGEKVSFSQDLIKEAVENSWQLTDDQLENLMQYSAQVPSI